jgi:hypothetical protein
VSNSSFADAHPFQLPEHAQPLSHTQYRFSRPGETRGGFLRPFRRQGYDYVCVHVCLSLSPSLLYNVTDSDFLIAVSNEI